MSYTRRLYRLRCPMTGLYWNGTRLTDAPKEWQSKKSATRHFAWRVRMQTMQRVFERGYLKTIIPENLVLVEIEIKTEDREVAEFSLDAERRDIEWLVRASMTFGDEFGSFVEDHCVRNKRRPKPRFAIELNNDISREQVEEIMTQIGVERSQWAVNPIVSWVGTVENIGIQCKLAGLPFENIVDIQRLVYVS